MRTSALALALFAVVVLPLAAQDGQLDPSFGTAGLVTTDFSGSDDLAYALALLPDGKLVAAGYARTGGQRNFSLARYLPAGSLDPAFGVGGKVVTDFAGGDDYGYAIVALSDLLVADGRIVVAGHARVSGGQPDFAVARYNADGTLDPTFGTGGLVGTDFAGRDDYGYALALQPDGKLLLGGDARVASGNYDFGLVRYNADGTLDPTFGTGGRVTTDFTGGYDGIGSLLIQPDGKIVAAGRTAPSGTSNYNFGLVRYNADGTLDPTFGTGGRVTTDFAGGDDRAAEVLRQPDGKLVVVGRAADAGSDRFGIARYNADGTLDATFGTGGTVLLNAGTTDSRAHTLVRQPDGKLVVAGRADGNFALVRLLATGALDPTFGTGGVQTTDIAGGLDAGNALVMQPDARLVLAGYAQVPGEGYNFALARYANQLGTPPVCTDPAQDPAYGGGYVLNSAQSRAFVRFDVPRGATSVRFYNTSNLVVGGPEKDAESGTPIAAVRSGDTFTFAAGPTTLFFPVSTASSASRVAFYVEITDPCGAVDVDPAFALRGEDEALDGVMLGPSAPNPATTEATIQYGLSEAGDVRLVVYDLLGREVEQLVSGHREAGHHTLHVDVARYAPGVYVYRLTAHARTRTHLLTVAR